MCLPQAELFTDVHGLVEVGTEEVLNVLINFERLVPVLLLLCLGHWLPLQGQRQRVILAWG